MTIEKRIIVYNADTGETTEVVKTLEFIQTPKPTEEGYTYEEYLEETETQLIQHWVSVPIEATEEDYKEQLRRLGVEV